MINYSLALRSSNPLDETASKKVYAMAQYDGVMSLQQFSKHIAEHGSCFSRATIQGVLTEAVDCLREQLLLGNKVQLGEMGAFYCTLSSKGTPTAEEFNPEVHVTRVNVRWDRSSQFDDLLNDAKFRYVGSREAQAIARKNEKTSIDSELGVSGDDETGNEGGNGNGSGNEGGNGDVNE